MTAHVSEGGHGQGWTQARVDAEDAGEGVREDTSLGANVGSKALEAWTRIIACEMTWSRVGAWP